MEIISGGLTIVVPGDGRPVRKVAISPRDIYVSTESPPGPRLNRFEGTVVQLEQRSGYTHIRVQVGTHTLLVEQPTELLEGMDMKVGERVHLVLKLRWLRVLPEAGRT